MSDASFPGFPPEAMSFLAGLRDNNDRDWFTAHRATYDRAIKGAGEHLLAALEPALSELIGRPVSGKIFRIHRDVRFSKDKRPYNAHLHIAFPARVGEMTACGYFFALEPERVVVGAGGFDFSGPVLDAYRAAAADPKKGPDARRRRRAEARATALRPGSCARRPPAPQGPQRLVRYRRAHDDRERGAVR